MKNNITMTYKKDNGNTIEFSRVKVNKNFVDKWKNNSKVKFIFLDKKYSDLTFDDNVHEIHKFKSKYPGNSYVRFPLKLWRYDDAVYIKIDSNENTEVEPENYAVISKLDLRNSCKEMKKANKEKKIEHARELCQKALNEYNAISYGNVFCKRELNTDGKVLSEENIFEDYDGI